MPVYDTDKIENLYDDFLRCKKKYVNNEYSDFKEGYLYSINDSIIVKLRNKLSGLYSNINTGYNRIEKYWREYLEDIVRFDDFVADKGYSGINDSEVSSLVSKLKSIELDYSEFDSNLVSNAISVATTSIGEGLSEAGEALGSFFERVGATVLTVVFSIVEELINIVEVVVDLAVILVSAVATIGTGLVDLICGTDYTEQLWETTRAIVSYDISGTLFDAFYDETEFGQWIKGNAYGFEIVRSITCEIVDVIVVTALATVVPVAAPVLYGTLKAGQHIERNWQDENMSTFGGLFKGTLQGVADGAFFAIGMKGDKLAKAAVKGSGTTIFKKAGVLTTKMAFESGTSVIQDFTTIGFDVLFSSNTIVDENGKTITFNNLSEKASYYYEKYGGTDAIVSSMTSAFFLSGLSDSLDIFDINITKPIKNKVADSLQNAIKSNPDASAARKKFEEILTTVVDKFSGKDIDTSNMNVNKNATHSVSVNGNAFITPNMNVQDKFIKVRNVDARISSRANFLMDKYNYLLDLKNNGGVTEYLNKGITKDPRYGIDLTKIDAELNTLTKNINIMGNVQYDINKNIIIHTSEKKLYDSLEMCILDMNQYCNNNGYAIFRNYALGITDINSIPLRYRNYISSIPKDDLYNFIILRERMLEVSDFVNNGMGNKFNSTFSKYVDADQISDAKNVCVFLTPTSFSSFTDSSRAMAFNNGSNSYINLGYNEVIAKSNIAHESIHQLSYNKDLKISGIKINENYRGINETFTEYLTKKCMQSDYPKEPYCGYQGMVTRLENLVNKGVITDDDIMNAYFNNDVSILKYKINKYTGKSDTFDRLVNAFSEAHAIDDINNKYTKLDNVCEEIIYSMEVYKGIR